MRTAYQRLLEHEAISQFHTEALAAIQRFLNPTVITRSLKTNRNQLINRAKTRAQGVDVPFGEQIN
ncbi:MULTISPECIES: hypothetical protein [Paeniglutamicibacter]|uniref:Uncharacterized protein n=1 Tax=Paeniglutamicibacter sulfureus TaxID=43666 RepID=A0ABU2BKJ6_9MICC|nr:MULTISPECIES: hypothetical protein [Paeniglutamicibacter]MCV9994228.1 hypothetical protein [Paeniglutamicibacter sp. ZC-3]MDO2934845.1 hypothetical protein [Paeniglutamicibacter sulfureus]MDR7359133.1 hypothetical protein [Paeniglutamicibacter sulfureus]